MEDEFDKLAEKYKTIPPDVREAISSTEVAVKIEDIAKEQGLLLDKADVLAEETALVMLGLSNPSNFVSTLRRKLGVSEKTAIQIANEINDQVFKEIRESLRKLYEERKEEENTEHDDAAINKQAILNEIENPTPSQSSIKSPPVSPTSVPPPPPPIVTPNTEEKHLEVQPESHLSVIDKVLETPQVRPVVADKKYTVDPYREPLK